MVVECMACGHQADAGDGPPFEEGIFHCSECSARMAYGKLLLRECIEPYTDERGKKWLRRRFQDPKTKADLYVVDVDPQFAAMVAKNILSLVIP